MIRYNSAVIHLDPRFINSLQKKLNYVYELTQHLPGASAEYIIAKFGKVSCLDKRVCIEVY